MSEPVIVRFAPSPTGYLHIGGARTAIFNYLYARKTGGKFILRIEDTDSERSTENAIDGILDGLSWLGLDWDEGPNFQSRFIDAHRETARRLLTSGHAYKCFCTKEELDAKREEARKQKKTYQYDRSCRYLSPEEIVEKEGSGLPFTIRFRVPEGAGAVRFNDVVYGPIEKQYADLDDFVIVRSNGQPLYVLSNAVDDMQDGITHVIRGQDGLANTPKQVLIYEALNVPVPRFAHMSLTLDPQKAKISKRRHGEAVAIHFYRERGFLPWALVNFLVLLGWSPGDSREYFTKPELIEAFSLEGISKTNSVFNIRKDDPRFFTDPKAIKHERPLFANPSCYGDPARGPGADGKSRPLESGLGKGKSPMVHGYGGSHSCPVPYDGGFCGTGTGLFFRSLPHGSESPREEYPQT